MTRASTNVVSLAAGLCVAFAGSAVAATDPTVAEAQKLQLERVRGEIADQLQLQAYDLVDELVFDWLRHPPFGAETPVVLADVGVPVSFGSGLQALIENHFADVVVKNPKSHVQLTHCPACTAMVVHSGSKGTVVSRGVDAPEALALAGASSQSKHALFLDFEIEGSALVLRARITTLSPQLPIVYAKTLSTTTTSPALLRAADQLKSAEDARKEYLDTLEGRSTWAVPVRATVRTFPRGYLDVATPPFIWLQAGVEAAFTQARAWLASFSVGLSWAPESHTAWLAQARLSRLLTGSVTSLTHPDLYVFLGGSVMTFYGPTALIFQDRITDIAELSRQLKNIDAGAPPTKTFAAFQLGLELRVKNRIGLGVFVEVTPALANIDGVGTYVDLGLFKIQTFGVETSFCF